MAFRLTTVDAFLLGSLMAAPQIASNFETDKLQVIDGRVSATDQKNNSSSGFLTLRNSTAKAETIVGASSPSAGAVEVHSASVLNGAERKQKVDSLSVPAGGEIRFKPDGHHLMIDKLKTELVEGQKIQITLHLASGRNIPATMLVSGSASEHDKEIANHENH